MAATNVTLKVGSVYYELDLDDKKFKQKSKSVKDETKSLGNSFSGLGNSAKALGAALGLSLSVGALIQGFRAAINAARELEQSMIGLQRVAARFGQDTMVAKQAAQDLASDGLITVATAADGLQKLMIAGLGLPEAIELMEGYKDQAAFGRAATLSMDQAVGNLAESFYTENSAIGNLSGQTENWNMIMEKGAAVIGKSVSALNEEERVLAKLYGQRLLNNIVEGDAAQVAGTLGGAISKLQTETYNLSAAIGTALAPGLQFAISQFTGFSTATEGINQNMLVIQSVIIGLVGSFIILGKAGLGAAKVIRNAMTLNFGAARDAFYEMIGGIQQTFVDTQQKIVDNTIKSYDTMDDVAQASADNQVKIQSEKERKIAKQLEDETYNFEKNMQKRDKAFAESLADMIFSHLDKVEDLKKRLADETADFNENMDERSKKFKATMDKMVKDHEKKTSDLKKQIIKEQEDLSEAEAEKLEEAQERIAKETKEYEKKRLALETQIDKEVAKGKNASQTRIRLLQEELAIETESYEEKVQEINAKVDKEVAKQRKASAERIADLNERLAEEQEAFNQAKVEAEQSELDQTAKLKKEHETRKADYEASLKAEQEILSRHQEHVDKVKDQAREDDISRLIRQHNEEREEAAKEHQRRMSDIRSRGDEMGKALANTTAAGFAANQARIQSEAEKAGRNAAAALDSATKVPAREAGRNMVQALIDGIRDKISGAYNYISEQFRSVGNYAKSLIPGFAGGVTNFKGGLAVVGEQGPELVRLPPGSDVIPNQVAFGGGATSVSQTNVSNNNGVTQDIRVFIDKVSNMDDVDALGREFGFRAALMPTMGAR